MTDPLFTVSSLLPGQLPQQDHGRCRAERRLLTAILCSAVHDLSVLHPGLRSNAFRWIASNSEAPFSFVFVCLQLGFDPSWIRNSIVAA